MEKEDQYNLFLNKENSRPLTEQEIKRREELRENPFPGVLSEEEFVEIKKRGQQFLEGFARYHSGESRRHVKEDRPYSALLHRQVEEDFTKRFVKGEVTRNYRRSILLVEQAALASQRPEKIGIASRFFEGIRLVPSDYDESIHPEVLFGLYEDDPTGKTAIDYIAAHKVIESCGKLRPENKNHDVIGLDTGVFVADEEAENVKFGGEKVKPTYTWLRRPKSKAEMRDMLEKVAGKQIEVVTTVVISFRILDGGQRHLVEKRVEVLLKVRSLSPEEISAFVDAHFEEGNRIAGGVDYVTYGKELLEDPQILTADVANTLKGAPLSDIQRLWAEVQVLRRAVQIASKEKAAEKAA